MAPAHHCCFMFHYSIQFNFIIHTLYKIFTLYIVRWGYINKVEEEGKKRKINGGLGRSVGGQRS